ncbi:MAG: bifunctional UDP-N-acetylglucosamine diphosphorylase/glucosamine-1-phosphate N-acetyltransferase GlmU [Alphaproteobacteria bacterium]|nr:MAG: bifunctional UDP-N-acetylglucosamine diphosphorylase/glucosamine-1-phosphate N-acetyltransferase GlmU [Alphaproteobacteria bacterium]
MASQKLAVLVLAAGKSTRMKSSLSKVLHPVGGRALIGHVLAMAADLAPAQTFVVVGKDMDQISDAIAPTPSIIQDPPKGTGHAVQCARDALSSFTGKVLVVYGDTPLLLAGTIQAMLEVEADVVVLGFRPEDTAAYGRLKVGKNNTLDAIIEFADDDKKQRANILCNSGVMMLTSPSCWAQLDLLRDDNKKGELYLTDIVEITNGQGGRCVVVEADADELLGVDSREDLAKAEAIFQQRMRAQALQSGVSLQDPSSVYFAFDTQLGRDVTVAPHVVFGPGVTVEDGVAIEAFSHIEGAHIGTGSRIGPFARLRPGADIGRDVHIGNYVEVKKSRIDDGAKANHLAYIGDAHVGAATNIGAGTITANYDGFNKHKTIIGAGVSVGSNTVLVAPVSIGDGALIGAGSTITEDVPKDDMVVVRADRKDVKGGGERFRAARKKDK